MTSQTAKVAATSNQQMNSYSGRVKYSPPKAQPALPTRHQATTRQQPGAQKCRFCMQQHITESCPKLMQMTVPQRMEALRRTGFCFRCLTRGHMARDCPVINPPICRVCSLGHQSMLHPPAGVAAVANGAGANQQGANGPPENQVAANPVRASQGQGEGTHENVSSA